MLDCPQITVFLDGDDPVFTENYRKILVKHQKQKRIFIMTAKQLRSCLHLHQPAPFFGHHLTKAFDESSIPLISKLMIASQMHSTRGLDIYFPQKTVTQKITIHDPKEKEAAVNAIDSFFQKKAIPSRLASLVASAVDELILNAIFVAPRESGVKQHFVQTEKSDEPFPALIQRRGVQIETASCDQYVGILVSDPFGGLKTERIFQLLTSGNRSTSTQTVLGLKGMFNSGLSLLFSTKPKMETEIMIFFPRVNSYKKFREGLKFLTIFSPSTL